MKPGIYADIANEDYHADRTAASSTWLKLLNTKTPYHLRSYLDSPPAAPTPALVMGSAVDCLIFEPEMFDKQFIVHPVVNRRTNAGKDEWAALEARSKKSKRYLLSEEAKKEALITAQAIRTNPRMAEILQRGVAQQTVVWQDPVTGILCKCKTDWYDEEDGTIYDLKTAASANPDDFSRSIHNFGYHIQAAFYTDGYMTAGLPVRRFVFGVIEKPDNRNTFEASPNLMAWYELSAEDMQDGQDSYTSALAALNFCFMYDEWEGYTNDIRPISRPGWARKTNVEKVASL